MAESHWRRPDSKEEARQTEDEGAHDRTQEAERATEAARKHASREEG